MEKLPRFNVSGIAKRGPGNGEGAGPGLWQRVRVHAGARNFCCLMFTSVWILACSAGSVELRGVSPDDFPVGLVPPQLSLGSDLVDDFCGWANDNQLSFPLGAANSVFVSDIGNVGRDNTAAADLLSVFLFDQSSRVNLALRFGPETAQSRTDLAPIVPAISREGIWVFHRRMATQCSAPEMELVSLDGLSVCVEASPVDRPPEGFTEADYRQMTFALVAGAREQHVEMEVVTLLADGEVVGRAITAWTMAQPLDLVNRQAVCTPHLSAISFESPD